MSKAKRLPAGGPPEEALAAASVGVGAAEDSGPAPRSEPRAAVEVTGGPASWLTWLRAKIAREPVATWTVLIMGFLLFFPFLGSLGLWDPWETHYGEVARAMIARDDYVYPYWESAYFFSKPALPMWLMAAGMLAVGAEGAPPGEPLGSLVEWGVRTPFALIAILCLWAVYRIGTHLKDRATGVLAAFVLGSCPQFIFIGKQAMVDMPLVGFMTAGLALFILAVFDPEEDAPAETRLKIITGLGIAAATFIQLFLIGREMKTAQDLAPIIGAALLALGFIVALWLKGSRRDCWLAGFYTFTGLAAAAKGLAVLAVVGPTVVLYMLVSGDWALLKRSKVLIGGVLFLLVASPWYVTLTLFKGRDDEGLTFTQRFWQHDNFGRVGTGVHGDRAGLGYFFEQLAYAMFPWFSMVPVGLGLVATHAGDKELPEHKRRALLFVMIWGLWCFVFFTISQTKFHHYIFPGVPALAMIAAYWFSWVAEEPSKRLKTYAAITILAIFAVSLRDLLNEPNNLVNLFTYKYDREFPRDIVPQPWIGVIAGVGIATAIAFYEVDSKNIRWVWLRVAHWAMGLFGVKPNNGNSQLAFFVMACVFGAWVSHHHFNMLSPHWSQAHLFKTYFEEKKGDEPIYAYQLNWRGETFYSRNRVLQVKEGGADQRMRSLVDQPGREFIVVEQSRFQTLKSILSPDKRDKLQIIDKSSNKFYLCLVEE